MFRSLLLTGTRVFWLVLISLLVSTQSCSLSGSGRLPNFIIILTDDQGYNDLGCFGSEKIKTPRIDRMAREGLMLTNYYSAAPLCGPSRASMLTGCYSQRLAERNNRKEFHTIIHKDEILISELLKEAGYATAAIGKWHIAGCGRQTITTDNEKAGLDRFSAVDPEIMPCQQGFDSYFGIPYSNDMKPAVLMRDNDFVEEIGHGEGQRGITTRYTDEALNFIESNQNKPFFLYLAHNMPHTPLWPGKEFEGKSEYGFYGDCIEEIDWNVGRILDRLEELGLDENTFVIYTSDNGPWNEKGKERTPEFTTSRLQAGNALPLRGYKLTTHDGGLRVPCVMRYPDRIRPGQASDELVTSMELLPTMARLAGAEVPGDRVIDGLDLTAFLSGKKKRSPRKTFYYYKWTHLHAIRDGEWKLVLPREAKPPELKWYHRLQEEVRDTILYNLKSDIGESANVADQYPDVVKRMTGIVKDAQADLGDGRWGIPGPGIRKKPVLASTAERPNVLFILIDDFGWMDVGYNGSSFYETPRIDQLAQEWMRFDYCYTPSPMCSPTRASILTGKNPARHGITQWLPGIDKSFVREGEKPRVYCPPPQSPGIKDREVTLGEAFQQAGYETAFYGKWHMGKLNATGGPALHGYDTQKAVIEENRCSMFFPFRDSSYFPGAKEGDNFTDLLTNAAIEFVTSDRERPFYLHLAHFAMHAPIESKPDLRDQFQEKAAALPVLEKDREMDDYAHKPQKLRRDDPEYAGELANLDRNIGRLIEALKSSGQYDNTIVILTGDNGGRSSYFRPHPTSIQPLRTGKTFIFEGGLRTPLLIHWPGHTETGVHSEVPVTSMDFYPTLLEMAGLPFRPKQHVDGVSLVPLIRGNSLDRSALYWHFPHYQGEGSYPASAIRKGRYKLIHNYHHDDVLLFDVLNDPYEKSNLAPSFPEKARELDNELMGYLYEAGAYIPKQIRN